MKRCPACRRVYDRDADLCRVDGTILDDFDSDPLVGQSIAKRYRLVRRLGQGSLGAVYLAAELATGKKVAVKMLVKDLHCDDDVLKQCMWDARFATASQPANVIRVYEVDRTDEGQIFIAMEYSEGEPLSDLIQREGALELCRALRLASQIAQGLAAASRAGVAHRDIKPQNVMVTGPDERVKVTDFGIAWLRRAARGGSLTRPGDGASQYLPPELRFGADADDRTDIYSIGAVLHAMLAGAAPSTARDRTGADSDDRWEAPAPIRTLRPDVPAALEHFLTRAMARAPERRHNGMDEFAEDLLDLTAAIIETQTKQAESAAIPESTGEPAASSPRSVARVAVEPESERSWRSCLGRWQAYHEQWQARREQWQAQWPVYRARWQAERERWRARLQASRAPASKATGAVARAATGVSRRAAEAAGTVAVSAARHGLAGVTRAGAGAATGASRAVATTAATVAGAVAAASRGVPVAASAVGHGLRGVARAGAGVANGVRGAIVVTAGTVAGAAAAAARAVPVVSRAGARAVAPVSHAVAGVAGTVAGVSRAALIAATAAGRGLAGVSRASAGAAMSASRTVAGATRTVAGAVAASVADASGTVPVAPGAVGRALASGSRGPAP